jgi:hypothetical protein
MGYDLSQDIEATRFHIPAARQAAALAALQALPEEEYAWVGDDWRHSPTLPADTLFAALAPFVTEDSWIPCDGNGGEDHWAWWFHDGRCWEVPGAVVYDRDAATPLTDPAATDAE